MNSGGPSPTSGSITSGSRSTSGARSGARIVGVQIGSSWTNVLERSRLNAVVYGELQPMREPRQLWARW